MGIVSTTLALLCCAGCFSGTKNLQILSDPRLAEVYVDGDFVGRAPLVVPQRWWFFCGVVWGEAVHLRLEKRGYEPVTRAIRYDGRFWGPFSDTARHRFRMLPAENQPAGVWAEHLVESAYPSQWYWGLLVPGGRNMNRQPAKASGQ